MNVKDICTCNNIKLLQLREVNVQRGCGLTHVYLSGKLLYFYLCFSYFKPW